MSLTRPKVPALGTFFATGITVLGFAAPVAGQTVQEAAAGEPVTFTRDIAPLLQENCQNCHRPGSIAPMALITYEQVRPWARAIKLKTETRKMPPWPIDKTVGIQEFRNGISLTEEEIALIGKWADAGAPEGDPADMPPPR